MVDSYRIAGNFRMVKYLRQCLFSENKNCEILNWHESFSRYIRYYTVPDMPCSNGSKAARVKVQVNGRDGQLSPPGP